jgi:tRNA-Thr(GGU) m(6)t(6)A37 methyltransferase TsaA
MDVIMAGVVLTLRRKHQWYAAIVEREAAFRSRTATDNGQVGDLDAYTLHPIGVVRSELVDRANAPRQGDEGAPDATIEFVPAVHAGLDGIQEGQELIVLTWLHQAQRDVLNVHPRDDVDRPLAGVFGTRSSDRPNPIGLHRVTVRAVEDGRLRVGPLEAIDGTPVVDIKPVLRGPSQR